MLQRPRYADCGPTFSSEQLAAQGLAVSRETLRQWMNRARLWQVRRRRIKAVHVWRTRRSCFGELVMLDGTPYRWLKQRGPQLHLIAMNDDATSRIRSRFTGHDSTEENLRTLEGRLRRWGRTVALNTDKHRSFQLAGMDTPEDANRFLEITFLPQWEQRFTVAPRWAQDAHRPLGRDHHLEQILSVRVARAVAADYTARWQGQRWGVPREQVCAGLRGAQAEIKRRLDGRHWLRFRGRYLPLRLCLTAAFRKSFRPTASRTCGTPPNTKIPPASRAPLETALEADTSALQETGRFDFAFTLDLGQKTATEIGQTF